MGYNEKVAPHKKAVKVTSALRPLLKGHVSGT
jgi:hypothetical protein